MKPDRKITAGADLLLVNTPLKNYDLSPRRNDFTLPTIGLGYIATCAELAGFAVDVLDAEALGLGLSKIAGLINDAGPRWVGLNLLAPTYVHSVGLLRLLDPGISVMLGGHQAKAMPRAILEDVRIPRIDALVLGEAETRVPRLLADVEARRELPGVYWRQAGSAIMPAVRTKDPLLLAPDVDAMPLLDRRFLQQDPYIDDGVLESAMVASRGCPFDCSFCGAAISSNPDVTVRMRRPDGLMTEIRQLRSLYGVQRIRFVDDLFLANTRLMRTTLNAFIDEALDMSWDATGRINVLATARDDLLALISESGCREVALGIETGSDRLLSHVDKKITVAQVAQAVIRLCRRGIHVKGYFILGLPTETRGEHQATLDLIRRLWDLTEGLPGRFRCSVFEYRPYPGTPDWQRLIVAGYSPHAMLKYADSLDDESFSPDRDEFNFSTGLQFGEVPVTTIRQNLAAIMREQRQR
ncbi:radical SAM protein [Bradyrhizobium elkanii]|uniref:Radical SAM protein n=1 Tax=Bradyrhizobium elkanii TaxID=29448 RepID=A0A4U6RG03_BRAEL|nr:radical SAM protein [Bradyrhizobium elkanii]TKV71666.1 radical SAM protein [Bradyrhizobium elkanii]